MKQIDFDNNKIIDENLIKRFIFFVHNVEEKLLSIKTIYDKLYQLMETVSITHQIILQDLINIKMILNETTIEQEEDELDLHFLNLFLFLFFFCKELFQLMQINLNGMMMMMKILN